MQLARIRPPYLPHPVYAPIEEAVQSSVVGGMRTQRGWEPDETRAWQRIVAALGAGTFLDGGAYIGHYAFVLASLGCEVVAVEPILETFLALRTTAERYQPKVKAVNAALWFEDGETIVNQRVWQAAQSSCFNDGYLSLPKRVRAVTIDSLAEQLGVTFDYVKLDVEGAERYALRGAKRTLEMVKVLMLEFNPEYHVGELDWRGELSGFSVFNARLNRVDEINADKPTNFFLSRYDLSAL